jgi:hypothetical protein
MASDLSAHQKEVIDAILEEVDDKCVALGLPILSVLVRHPDGRVSDAFWLSVKKHGLRKPDETDQQVEERLKADAFDSEYPPEFKQ